MQNGALIETTFGRMVFNRELNSKDRVHKQNDRPRKNFKKYLGTTCSRTTASEPGARSSIASSFLGYEMATTSGITWAISELIIPKEKAGYPAGGRYHVAKVMEQFKEGLLTDAERKVADDQHLERSAGEDRRACCDHFAARQFDLSDRGFRITRIVVAADDDDGHEGARIEPERQTIELPIRSSLKEGLSVLEYFIATQAPARERRIPR